MTDETNENRMVLAAERIATSLEELVALSRPKEIDIEKLMAEAMQALMATNPVMRHSFEQMERQLKAGDENASSGS